MSKRCSCLLFAILPLIVVALPTRSARAETEPHYAPPEAAAAPQRPWVRPHRLAVGLSFTLGYAGLGGLQDLQDRAAAEVSRLSGMDVEWGSHLTKGGHLSLRYFAHYWLLFEVGFGLLHSGQVATVGSTSETLADVLVLELPLLIGLHRPLGRRWWFQAGAGPAIYLHNAIMVDSTSDGEVSPTVGFHAMAGVDYLVLETFSLGLEFRFRYASMGTIYVADTEIPLKALPSDTDSYDLDMTGFSALITARLFVF
jgi:hypothetical protein